MTDEPAFEAEPFCHPAQEGKYLLGDVWDIFEGGSEVLFSLPAMLEQMRQMTRRISSRFN